jgi:hypothetical protein
MLPKGSNPGAMWQDFKTLGLWECFRHGEEGRRVEGSVNTKGRGTSPVTISLVTMSSLRDDDHGQVLC